MPNTAKLAIEISVDDKGLVKIDSIGPRTEESIKKAKRSVSSLNQAVKKLGGVIAAKLTFDVIKHAVASFASFEDQLLITKAATGATVAELELLKEKALELGGDPAQTPAMVAEGMAELARAGQDVNDIMASVAANAQLAAGSELDFGQAAEFTTDILSQFGRGAAETQNLVDVLIAGANSASVTVTQMAESYKYAGAMSDSMGVSTNQTAASLLVLANSGIKASEGGTSLRAIWSQLLKNSDQLSDSYGVQVEEMRNGKVVTRELADIIDDLSKVELTAKERTKLFGQIAGPGMAVLLKKGGDAIREYESDLDNAAGTGARVARTLQEGTGGALRQIASDAQVAGLKIGEFFAPAVKGIADISHLASTWVDALTGTFYTLSAGVSAFAGTIFDLQGKIEGLTDKVGLTDASTNSWAQASDAAMQSALDLAEKGEQSFNNMLGASQAATAEEEKYKATLEASKETILADQEAQEARSTSVVASIEEIAAAEKKVADERQATVSEMYKTLGIGGEEYFRNEAQKLIDQAATWEAAGADQLVTQQYLYDEITSLSVEAWAGQDQAAGMYLDGLTASFTSATDSISADIDDINTNDISIDATADTAPAEQGIANVKQSVESLDGDSATVNIDADTSGFDSATIAMGGTLVTNLESVESLQAAIENLNNTPTLDPFGDTRESYTAMIDTVRAVEQAALQERVLEQQVASAEMTVMRRGAAEEVAAWEIEQAEEVAEQRMGIEEERLQASIDAQKDALASDDAILSAYRKMADDQGIVDLTYFQAEADALTRQGQEWQDAGVEAVRIQHWMSGELAGLRDEASEAGVNGLGAYNDALLAGYQSTGNFSDETVEAQDELAALQDELDSLKESGIEGFMDPGIASLESFQMATEFAENHLKSLKDSLSYASEYSKKLGSGEVEVQQDTQPSLGISSLRSFDGGGYTGFLPRTGGIDGKGGFQAILHPNETVVDHTKQGNNITNNSMRSPTTINNNVIVNVQEAITGNELDNFIERQKIADKRAM